MTFTALADPTRFRIVEMLAASGQLPVAEIRREFAMSAPAISQHLKILKEARLVQAQVKAQQRIYRLNPQGISEIEHWLARIRRQWEARFDALDALLIEEHAKTTSPKRKKP